MLPAARLKAGVGPPLPVPPVSGRQIVQVPGHTGHRSAIPDICGQSGIPGSRAASGGLFGYMRAVGHTGHTGQPGLSGHTGQPNLPGRFRAYRAVWAASGHTRHRTYPGSRAVGHSEHRRTYRTYRTYRAFRAVGQSDIPDISGSVAQSILGPTTARRRRRGAARNLGVFVSARSCRVSSRSIRWPRRA